LSDLRLDGFIIKFVLLETLDLGDAPVTLSTGVYSRGVTDESIRLNHSLPLSGSNGGAVIEVERSSNTENFDLQGPLEGIDRMWEREEESWHLPFYNTFFEYTFLLKCTDG
jgi:hypothetical protein